MKQSKGSIFSLVVLIISLVVGVGLLRSIIRHFSRSDIVGERQQALITEEKKNMELHERLLEATSPGFIEKQAREKLGLVREGETIILLQSPMPFSRFNSENQEQYLSNWKRWWRLFF